MQVNLTLIKEKRQEKGFSIDEMAKFLGLTNGSMYWKRENGDYRFKAEEIMQLSEILGVPFDRLFLTTSYSKIEIPSNKDKKAI